MLWLIVELGKQQFGLPLAAIHELAIAPEVTPIAGLPPYFRGVMNLRGRVVPVLDFRRYLGMRSTLDEASAFCEMMEQRRRDHVRWLGELDASVEEGREFRLATDPHQCAFGKWYDAYQPQDPWVGALLKRFDAPHRKIHATANEALAIAGTGAKQSALDVIDARRHSVLAEMNKLFSDLQRLVRESLREIAVVLEIRGTQTAALVDAALSIEKFEPDQMEQLTTVSNPGISQVAHNANRSEPVLLVSVDALMN